MTRPHIHVPTRQTLRDPPNRALLLNFFFFSFYLCILQSRPCCSCTQHLNILPLKRPEHLFHETHKPHTRVLSRGSSTRACCCCLTNVRKQYLRTFNSLRLIGTAHVLSLQQLIWQLIYRWHTVLALRVTHGPRSLFWPVLKQTLTYCVRTYPIIYLYMGACPPLPNLINQHLSIHQIKGAPLLLTHEHQSMATS
jgi:hypothetical protein